MPQTVRVLALIALRQTGDGKTRPFREQSPLAAPAGRTANLDPMFVMKILGSPLGSQMTLLLDRGGHHLLFLWGELFVATTRGRTFGKERQP